MDRDLNQNFSDFAKPSQPAPGPTASPASFGSAAAPALSFDREKQCEGSLEMKTEGSSIRTWATFTDIGVTGCYVEMMTTFPIGTKMDSQLGMSDSSSPAPPSSASLTRFSAWVSNFLVSPKTSASR